MKKSSKLLIGFAVIAALIIGFLIGISVDYPKISTNEIAGTIGKVNNYRNTKVSEEDIQLKNELLEDTVLLKSLTNYFSFHYLKSIDLVKNINLAVQKASEDAEFKSAYETSINSLKKYASFLEATRKNLILGVTALQNANEINPIDLRTIIARAQNIIVQANYKNQNILDFIDNADEFIMNNGTKDHKGVTEAHDLLMLKQINHSFLTKDKMVLKFLDKKKIYNNIEKEQLSFSFHNAAANDMESLKSVLDAEKLSWAQWDSEKLSWFDSEKLGWRDAEKLEAAGGTFDAEKLNAIFVDAEQLGRVAMDAEKLGHWDSEKLESVLDSENLGSYYDTKNLENIISF